MFFLPLSLSLSCKHVSYLVKRRKMNHISNSVCVQKKIGLVWIEIFCCFDFYIEKPKNTNQTEVYLLNMVIWDYDGFKNISPF